MKDGVCMREKSFLVVLFLAVAAAVAMIACGSGTTGPDTLRRRDVTVDTLADTDVSHDPAGDTHIDGAGEIDQHSPPARPAIAQHVKLSTLPFRERVCISLPVFMSGPSETDKLREAFVGEKLQEAGVRWLRRAFRWHLVEKTRGDFDFAVYDREVKAIKRYNVQILGVLAYGNPWATAKTSSDKFYPPDDPADFANYVKMTVTRFKNDLYRWEVWNEQNAGYRFWKPSLSGDAVAYAKLLKLATEAAHAADKNALVAFGGPFFYPQVITGAIEFTTQSFVAEPSLPKILDRMAAHPYMPYPSRVEPENHDPSAPFPTIPFWQMLDQTIKLFPGRPLWLTEVGWPVAGDVTLAKHANYLIRSFLLSFAAGAELICWYDFVDREDFETRPDRAHGLFHYSADWKSSPPVPKPAFQALKTLNMLLGDATTATDISADMGLKAGEFALRLVANERRTIALWRTDDTPERVIELRVLVDKAFDIYGKPLPIASDSGLRAVVLRPSVTYIIERPKTN